MLITSDQSIFAGASWISSEAVGSPRTSAPAPFFRRNIALKGEVVSAKLLITALGLYECEINGCRVGDHVFSPGWTDYRRRVQYQTYDVTGLLTKGENALGIILGDGWYCGFIAWKGRQYYGDRPLCLARLDVLLKDGSSVTVTTDEAWKTAVGPIMESDLLMGETYDARRELREWSKPGYDDSLWSPVITVYLDPAPELSPELGPPVRRVHEIGSVSFDKETGICDFGQNFAGRVRLKLRSKRGTVVKLQFAEMLDAEGKMYIENLRGARATDYYIAKGGGEEVWESRFTFHGFRYVQVAGLNKDDFVELIGVVLHSDMQPVGSFSCSNELLNKLQQNIVWGQRSNFLEVPTDCPQRDERLGWTGDAQVFCRTAAFNMDVAAFFRKWLRDMRDAQRPNGGIPPVIPSVCWDSVVDGDGGPAWADAAIICPWTIYLCYGDTSILEDNFEMMQRFMEFIAKERCLDRIRSHPDIDQWGGFGDWLALDGSQGWEGATSKDLIGTAFYAGNAAIMQRVASILGKDGEAAEYCALHSEIVDAFRNRFVTPEGLVVPGTQTAYVLALYFDLLPEKTRPVAARELVREIKKRKFHLATGFVGTPYLLQVLEQTGHIEIAYSLLEQEDFPSWLFPVKNGATTIWERWDGWTPSKGFQDKAMNSFNHYAYGSVGAWMYSTVAGLDVDPLEPGYRHIIFRPRPGGSLTWAEAKLHTMYGEVGIRWELKESSLNLRLLVPDECHATFLLPRGYSHDVFSYGPGTHVLTCAKIV